MRHFHLGVFKGITLGPPKQPFVDESPQHSRDAIRRAQSHERGHPNSIAGDFEPLAGLTRRIMTRRTMV